MTKHKIGDTITAKFSTAFQKGVVVTGIIREFKGDMICCNQVGTNKPFFCLAEEVIDKQVNLMEQFIVDGGFDKAFQDVFGLPVEVVESLKEVC